MMRWIAALLAGTALLGCVTVSKRPDLAVEYYNLGNSYFKLQQYEQAARTYRKALELDPALNRARFNLVLTLNKLGQPREAQQMLESLLRKDPENQGMLELLAWTLHLQGRSAEALDILSRLLALAPDNATALYNQGALLMETGEPAAAIGAFTRLLKVSPEDKRAMLNLGRLYLQTDQPEPAARVLGEYLQVDPAAVEAHLLLASAFERLKRFDAALQAYSDALSYKENLPEAWFGRAALLLTEVQDPERGLTALTQALEFGFKDTNRIGELLDRRDLLDRERVEALLAGKSLLPKPAGQ